MREVASKGFASNRAVVEIFTKPTKPGRFVMNCKQRTRRLARHAAKGGDVCSIRRERIAGPRSRVSKLKRSSSWQTPMAPLWKAAFAKWPPAEPMRGPKFPRPSILELELLLSFELGVLSLIFPAETVDEPSKRKSRTHWTHLNSLQVVLVALRQARPSGADRWASDGCCAALRGATRRSATSTACRGVEVA